MVPGHEIIGVVVEVGSKVEKLKVGDFAGIGYISGACRDCKMCKKNEEQYCKKSLMTYNSECAPTFAVPLNWCLYANAASSLPSVLHNLSCCLGVHLPRCAPAVMALSSSHIALTTLRCAVMPTAPLPRAATLQASC